MEESYCGRHWISEDNGHRNLERSIRRETKRQIKQARSTGAERKEQETDGNKH